jgi:PIN domain nuclease of toxin-antitoxin system
MKLLLDTHIILWWVNEHEKLSSEAKAMLRNDANTIYISIASAWEIAIKASLGKLSGFDGGAKTFLTKIKDMPVCLLPILPHHVEMVETLPFIHRDPFDRMLIATAKAEGMAIITADENIHKYAVQSVW